MTLGLAILSHAGNNLSSSNQYHGDTTAEYNTTYGSHYLCTFLRAKQSMQESLCHSSNFTSICSLIIDMYPLLVIIKMCVCVCVCVCVQGLHLDPFCSWQSTHCTMLLYSNEMSFSSPLVKEGF